jgi:hypothetical protein
MGGSFIDLVMLCRSAAKPIYESVSFEIHRAPSLVRPNIGILPNNTNARAKNQSSNMQSRVAIRFFIAE